MIFFFASIRSASPILHVNDCSCRCKWQKLFFDSFGTDGHVNFFFFFALGHSDLASSLEIGLKGTEAHLPLFLFLCILFTVSDTTALAWQAGLYYLLQFESLSIKSTCLYLRISPSIRLVVWYLCSLVGPTRA